MSLDEVQGAGVPAGTAAASTGAGEVTAPMLESLSGTRIWVRVVSITGFAVCGLMLLLAPFVAITGALTPELGIAGGLAMAAVYVLFAAVYFIPALLLHRYASAIRDLVLTKQLQFMEVALAHQRSFWRCVGIIAMAMIGLWVLIILVFIVGALVAAMTS